MTKACYLSETIQEDSSCLPRKDYVERFLLELFFSLLPGFHFLLLHYSWSTWLFGIDCSKLNANNLFENTKNKMENRFSPSRVIAVLPLNKRIISNRRMNFHSNSVFGVKKLSYAHKDNSLVHFSFTYNILSEWNSRSMFKCPRLRFLPLHFPNRLSLDSFDISCLSSFGFPPFPWCFLLSSSPLFKEHSSFATQRTGHDNSLRYFYIDFLKVHYGARKTTPSIKT